MGNFCRNQVITNGKYATILEFYEMNSHNHRLVSLVGCAPVSLSNRKGRAQLNPGRTPNQSLKKNFSDSHDSSGPYLGFFVCGGKLGFREISDQYSYKKQPSKIRHYVRKKTFSFPGGGNCPLRPPAMYGPVHALVSFQMIASLGLVMKLLALSLSSFLVNSKGT